MKKLILLYMFSSSITNTMELIKSFSKRNDDIQINKEEQENETYLSDALKGTQLPTDLCKIIGDYAYQWECTQTINDKFKDGITTACILPNHRIALGVYGKKIIIYDLKKNKIEQTIDWNDWIKISVPPHRITTICTVSENTIASGSNNDHSIKIWDLEKTKQQNNAKLASLNKNEPTKTLEGEMGLIEDISMRISMLGRRSGSVEKLVMLNKEQLVSSARDGRMKIWDIKSEKCLNSLKIENNGIASCICVLNDTQIASSPSSSNSIVTFVPNYTIKIWNINSNKFLSMLEGHTSYVRALANLPNNKLVSTSYDKTVKIWDIKTGQCLHTLKEDACDLYTLANEILAISCNDHSIKIFDMRSYECIDILKGHAGEIRNVLQLPDDSLVSCSYDNTIKIWKNPTISLKIKEEKPKVLKH